MSAAHLPEPDPGAAEATRRAVETPVELIDTDVEDLQNRPSTATNGDSPSKRTRWDVGAPAAPVPGPASITLEQLTAQLAATMAPVTGGMRQLQDRIASMESEVSAKMGPTLELKLWTADSGQ